MVKNPWVIIPTYNEKNNIETLITNLFQLNVPSLSVLIVDDNSPDGTAQAVRQLQSHFPRLHLEVRPQKLGLGPAYVHGFTYAIDHGADGIVQMDADFSHDPNDVPRLLATLKDYDLVLGSRYVQGISVINWPLRRLLLSSGANLYARLITGMPFKDVTAGFKAWRTTTLQQIAFYTMKSDGYGFQIGLTYLTWKKKLKIKEIPIVFTERRAGQSKMNKSIIWEALWLVWRLRFFG